MNPEPQAPNPIITPPVSDLDPPPPNYKYFSGPGEFQNWGGGGGGGGRGI